MSDSTSSSAQRTCPSCGTANWPSARYCGQCGTRLVDDAGVEREFERAVSDVLDAPATASSEAPASHPALSNEQWPTVAAQPRRSGKTVLWVVLGIFAFILACCCGLTLLVTITSSNDSALQRELSLLAGL